MLVEVNEGNGRVWMGKQLWIEDHSANGKEPWAAIRPVEYMTHVKRGSSPKQRSEHLVRIPLFLCPEITVTAVNT